ncbi:ligand-binding SRPBCC domain-containing protein [Thermonema lapsum]|uniref:Ligand-binding SRPBCC domain-containing protein n=1 Tax=Thermonema lapsum TaxID=28195 RepID=A0A846MPC8_9BACT|nr:SRPBCC family protein [Thermonema lapsum]NIK73438.1 ligand-binding SRPBCC domain-containing protein [Thermonema lapsum]
MKVYQLKREQYLPISLEEAWQFFSSPHNLKDITPQDMGFDIVLIEEGKPMYPGMIIGYKVRPLWGIPMRWLTEITHVQAPYYFVDEQRFGPYALWHHQHWFEEVEGGIKMTDLVHYALPLGVLGRLAHAAFVKKRLEEIFDYRFRTLERRFGSLQVQNELKRKSSLYT